MTKHSWRAQSAVFKKLQRAFASIEKVINQWGDENIGRLGLEKR